MIPSDEYAELIHATRQAIEEILSLRARIAALEYITSMQQDHLTALQQIAHTHKGGPDYMTQKW